MLPFPEKRCLIQYENLENEISSGPDEFGSEFGLFNHSLLQMHNFVATVHKLMISFQYHPGIPSYSRETEPIHYVLCSGQKKKVTLKDVWVGSQSSRSR